MTDDEIPLHVDDCERAIRGICSPYQLNKSGRLYWKSFYPPPDSNETSVIRHDHVGIDFCRNKSKALSNPSHGKAYTGMAIVRAVDVRSAGADIVDSRNVYLGHADILFPYPVPPRGEPLDALYLIALKGACGAIARASRYVVDPDPDHPMWTGELT